MKQTEKDQLITQMKAIINEGWFTDWNGGKIQGIKECVAVVEAMPTDPEIKVLSYKETQSLPVVQIVDAGYYVQFSSQEEMEEVAKLLSVNLEGIDYKSIKENYPEEVTFTMSSSDENFTLAGVNADNLQITYEQFISKIKSNESN